MIGLQNSIIPEHLVQCPGSSDKFKRTKTEASRRTEVKMEVIILVFISCEAAITPGYAQEMSNKTSDTTSVRHRGNQPVQGIKTHLSCGHVSVLKLMK